MLELFTFFEMDILKCFGLNVILLFSISVSGQNLVLNPSFEEHTDCPTLDINVGTYTGMDIVVDWYTPTSSTDYFHACGDDKYGVPNNFSNSFQYARTGDAYVGGFLAVEEALPRSDVAEYVQGTLMPPLVQDSFYYVELFVNLSEKAGKATDEFGVLFTDTLLFTPWAVEDVGRSIMLPFEPQLENSVGNFIDDTENWVPLRWVYEAKGGEQFFTMGAFGLHEEITFINIEGRNNTSVYYFIDDVRIEKLPYHIANLGLQDTILCSQPFSVELSASPGPYSSYTWNTGAESPSITVTEPGVYVLEAVYEDFVIRDTAVMQYLPVEAFELGQDTTLCTGDLPYALPGPYGMSAYRWSTGDTTASLSVTEAGWYALEADYECGTGVDSLYISVDTVPVFDLGPDTLLCQDGALGFPLQAGGSYDSYAWNTGALTSGITVDTAGLYIVTATHPCRTLQDSIGIEQQPLLPLGLPADTLICPGDSVWISGNTGFDSYAWPHGPAVRSAWLSTPGSYALTGRYVCGEVVDSVRVAYAPEPVLSLPPELSVELGEPLRLPGPTGYAFYNWLPPYRLDCTSCARPLARPAVDTLYRLEVANGFGCTATDSILVRVLPRLRTYVPTAFSPNDDGRNDVLRLYAGPEVAKVLSFEVYGRWGNKVFSSAEPEPTWDGDSAGRPAAQGLYLWQAEVELLDGRRQRLRGEVSLLR